MTETLTGLGEPPQMSLTHFKKKEFLDFAKMYGFHHETLSPKYSQSNGFAECGASVVKNLLKKATDAREDPYLALFNSSNVESHLLNAFTTDIKCSITKYGTKIRG